jgi:predicted MPP superfamily phosphohydrolase
MGSSDFDRRPSFSRRGFLKTALGGAAGLALYSTTISRHWIEITHPEIRIAGLPAAFDGLRIAQLSDIHLDEYTEPFFLHHVIDQINQLRPDIVLLTGDYVSYGISTKHFAIGAAWHCAKMLTGIECKQVYAVLGNHDVFVDEREVMKALRDNGIVVLDNANVPIERAGQRFWLAGVDDPVMGDPKPELAIPPAIRDLPNEPVILMCHAPDYADDLLAYPSGQSVSLMLSGHTHGGQVRLPFFGAMQLPGMGKKYVEGLFSFGKMQLYVNRGIGTVGVPFRLDCPPEITLMTLRTA